MNILPHHQKNKNLIKSKFFLITFSLIFYLIVLLFLLPPVGEGITAFVIIPVMVIGWFTYNIWKGLIVGFLGSFVANSIIFSIYYREPILTVLIFHKAIPGALMVTLAGGIIGYLSNLQRRYKQEISSRKSFQLELQSSKEKIEHILRTIPSAVFLVDKELKITLWNRTAELITGLKEEEVIGKKCTEIWYCEECEKGCGLQKEEIKKPIFGKELEIGLKDGRKITIVKNVDVLLDEKGNFDGGIESFIDITDRKKMEDKIYESAESFKTVFNESKEGLLLIDTETVKYVEVNPAISEISGYTREELIGKPYSILFDKIDVSDRQEIKERILRGESVHHIEGTVKCKNGDIRYVIMGASSIVWYSKKVFFVYVQDVTPLKTLQLELEKKNREIINLTNTITHDLRNPLTGIRGIFELTLSGDKKLDKNEETLFRMALKEIEYMQSLLEDLLDAAKIDESKNEIKKEEIFAKEMIEDIINVLKFQIKEKNIDVLINVDNIKIFVDPNQFKKVLMNLLGNAINYIGSPKTPQIVIEGKEEGEEIRLSIKDNGIGIPQESLQYIFEKFKRGSNVGNIKGTGLGLFIVKNIVEKHGGKIFVESKVGEGSKFTIKLPCK